MRTILSLFVILLFVAGCGGGDSIEGSMGPMGPLGPEVVEPVEPDPVVPENQYCYSTDEETLIDFLADVLDREPDSNIRRPGYVVRWNQSPVLRIAEGTTDKERGLVEESVRLINQSLPDNYDIQISSTPVPAEAENDTIPDGEIYIDFSPNTPRGHGVAVPVSHIIDGRNSEIRAYHVWVWKLPSSGGSGQEQLYDHVTTCDKSILLTVTHELIHALGFSHSRYDWNHNQPVWRTMMTTGGPVCRSVELERLVEIPGQLDRDGLRAMYTLENGDYPEELRIDPEEECRNQ